MAKIVMVLLGDIRYDGRVRKEIATLMKAGHTVELVVSDFNKTVSDGQDLGIKIHYVNMRIWPNPALNFVQQLIFNRQAAAILKEIGPTHIHCHDLTSLLAGVWAKRKTKSKLIFDAHELMPESMGGIRGKVWGWIENRCIESCDHIIMPEKNRISYFKHKYPQVRKIVLLPNFPRRTDITNGRPDVFRDIYPIRKDQRIVLYTGLIGPHRQVEELIESITLCRDTFVLIILGRAFKGYEECLKMKINELGLADRVFLHEAVPYNDIIRYMASCDIGTAFYQNSNINNYYCASNKLYEYIALDKPVMTNDYPGLRESVEYFGQGVCLSEVSAEKLAESYERAIDPGAVTPGAMKFLWEDQQDVLIELYGKSGSYHTKWR